MCSSTESLSLLFTFEGSRVEVWLGRDPLAWRIEIFDRGNFRGRQASPLSVCAWCLRALVTCIITGNRRKLQKWLRFGPKGHASHTPVSIDYEPERYRYVNYKRTIKLQSLGSQEFSVFSYLAKTRHANAVNVEPSS